MRGSGLLRRTFNRFATFDHTRAQKFEWDHNRQTIRESFPQLYSDVEKNLSAGGLWHGPNDQFFGGDAQLFGEFVAHVRDRKCLEIGSGPFGFLLPARWIKDRVIIDPLADKYREEQLALTGKTFLTPDVEAHATSAEALIGALVGVVDGAIICRNALDHCEDALTILVNIAKYAARNCYLLLWTDIWHLGGIDDGHHNITRSTDAMNALLDGLGFDLIRRSAPVREGNDYLEYGCVAKKK